MMSSIFFRTENIKSQMLCITYGLHLQSGELISTDATLIKINWQAKSALTCPKHKLAYVSGPNCPHHGVLVVKQLFLEWVFCEEPME